MLYNFFIFEEKIKKGIGINPQRENRKETPCGEPISACFFFYFLSKKNADFFIVLILFVEILCCHVSYIYKANWITGRNGNGADLDSKTSIQKVTMSPLCRNSMSICCK
jgi:hypothetical protein